MSIEDERSLADEAPALPPVEDDTPDVTPEDFTFDDFLAGARPTRRRARLFMRADLIADMEQLADEIGDLDEGDERVAPLVERYEQVKADFDASGRWFSVEKRSSEWVAKFRRDTAKRLDIALDGDGDAATMEEARTLGLHQLAEQIVTPAGATYDGLRALYERNEGEVNKLFLAMRLANEQMAESAQVVGPDFSPKPSTSRAT